MVNRVKKLPTPDLNQPLTVELLGKAIRAKRTQSGLRLEDAAVLCGVSKQTLMTIERGKGTNKIDMVLKICHALGIKIYIHPWNESDEVDDGWF